MNMSPHWGFSSFGVGGYNHVAPTELRIGSSVAARTAALIQRQCSPPPSSEEGEDLFGF